MMWGVVWYGKWKGGFLFFFRRNFYEITRKKIRSVWIKAVGERMVGGRYVCSMGCLGGVVKTK